MELGDGVERALSAVGLTKEAVASWLGPDCGCQERQDKLNSLSAWAKRTLRKGADGAKGYLERLLGI